MGDTAGAPPRRPNLQSQQQTMAATPGAQAIAEQAAATPDSGFDPLMETKKRIASGMAGRRSLFGAGSPQSPLASVLGAG